MNLNICPKISVAALLLLVLPSLAHAKPVGIDFEKRVIVLEGVYEPKAQAAKAGLDAELEARKQGIAKLKGELTRTCPSLMNGADDEDEDASSALLRKGWSTAFRSQGSIIHPNGVLRVLLSAPLTSVFHDSGRKAQSLKVDGNVHVGFKLPGTVPMSVLHCGRATTQLSASTKADVWFVPTGRSDLKVVTLVLDGDNSLKAATAEDQAVIDSSNLAKLSPEGPKESAYYLFPVVSK